MASIKGKLGESRKTSADGPPQGADHGRKQGTDGTRGVEDQKINNPKNRTQGERGTRNIAQRRIKGAGASPWRGREPHHDQKLLVLFAILPNRTILLSLYHRPNNLLGGAVNKPLKTGVYLFL